jgi:hypothetical protein
MEIKGKELKRRIGRVGMKTRENNRKDSHVKIVEKMHH